jgi:hypothetical protein
MNEKCVACKQVMDDGPCIGRLCYYCIETAIVKIIKEENKGEKQ